MDGMEEEDCMQEEADHQACLRKVLFAKIEGSQAFLQAVSRIPDMDQPGSFAGWSTQR